MRGTGLLTDGLCISSYGSCSTGSTDSFLVSLLLMMYIRTNNKVSSNVIIDENIAVKTNVSAITKSFEEEQDISINWQRNRKEFKRYTHQLYIPVRLDSVIVIRVLLIRLTGEDRGIEKNDN